MFIKQQFDNYWFAFEQLTNDNKRIWAAYAEIQTNPRAVMWGGHFNKNFTSDGSGLFRHVISEVTNSDIYIMYVSTVEPHPLEWSDIDDYKPLSSDVFKSDGYLSHLVMFATIITKEGSPLCTHLGISSSIEGLVGGHKGLSLKLHSMGAREIKRINPSIRYMVNCPSFIMESLLIRSFKIHVGTVEMEKVLIERSEVTPRMFKVANPTLLKKEEYERYVEPWGFKEFGVKKYLLDVMEAYPPKLSVSDEGLRVVGEDIFIPRDSNHWLFQRPCKPLGDTHYILVDYKELCGE